MRFFSHFFPSGGPGIAAKLFFAVLGVCGVMVLGMGLAVRLHFTSDFLDYLGDVEEERLAALTMVLADEFEQKGNWDFLANDPRAWRKLVGRHVRAPAKGKKKARDPEEETLRMRQNWQAAFLRSSLGLMAGNRETLVAGQGPGSKSLWLPIVTDTGETAGWLVRAPLTAVTDDIDLGFQAKQQQALLIIAGLSLLLAAGASMLLSRALLAPLRRLAATTHELTSGNLAARVSLRTGDELAVLGRQLNQLADTLERNEQSRRAFMAEISHDLRTPLAILRGETEALEDGVRPLTRESAASLKAEVDILAKLVDDIHTLSLADINALTYKRTDMDLRACLEAALVPGRERFAAKGLRLEYLVPDTPVPVYGDPGRLTRVAHNVLENSLRYTDAGGETRVRCAREGDRAVLDVMDTAPAVDDEELEAMFERFHTGDAARNRKHSGSGLGLAICRSIVEAHGGVISAAHSPLGGVWVRVSLPLGTSPEGEER